MTTKTGEDLWDELSVSRVERLLMGETEPFVWVVGSEWLRRENSQWWIGADVPATEEQVREMLVEAGESPIIWASIS